MISIDKLVKSPFNYIGGKFKILPQILPLFPSKINTFYDVFGGGANVSLNIKANKIIYNDIVPYVCNTFIGLQNETVESSLSKIKKIISTYDLSPTNEEGFIKLRQDYNSGLNSWDYFYTLVAHSFNNQFRFNNNQEYNSSFRKNRIGFNVNMESNFVLFMGRLRELNIKFVNNDFRKFDLSQVKSGDFVYFDPPYLISTGNYNDGKRGFSGWGVVEEKALYSICDKLSSNGVKFAMSNVLENKGMKNDRLIDWSSKYTIHNIDSKFNNTCYRGGDIDKNKTVEILITNY